MPIAQEIIDSVATVNFKSGAEIPATVAQGMMDFVASNHKNQIGSFTQVAANMNSTNSLLMARVGRNLVEDTMSESAMQLPMVGHSQHYASASGQGLDVSQLNTTLAMIQATLQSLGKTS
jgi:hypothetical protein